jgi:hypothetical protein
LGADSFGHGLDTGDGGRFRERCGKKIGAVETRLAVNVGWRMESRALKGLVEADMKGNVIVLADGGE